MAGNDGVDTSLNAAYGLAISQAIERHWRRPDTIPIGQACIIDIRQIPGGEVTAVDVDASCPYDAIGRDSLERAVFAASPLPYAGFEPAFDLDGALARARQMTGRDDQAAHLENAE